MPIKREAPERPKASTKRLRTLVDEFEAQLHAERDELDAQLNAERAEWTKTKAELELELKRLIAINFDVERAEWKKKEDELVEKISDFKIQVRKRDDLLSKWEGIYESASERGDNLTKQVESLKSDLETYEKIEKLIIDKTSSKSSTT